MIRLSLLLPILAAVALAEPGTPHPQPVRPALAGLDERSFFLGREYFVLRSGRAELVVQADQADLGPAFTWLLFDARNPAQSARKSRAANFVTGEGFAASGLVVELGGYKFSALGHRTATRWIVEGGIPAVEAVWWAGGVRVTERISAIADSDAFSRTIRLEGADLMGPDSVSLRLTLPWGSRALGSQGIACEGNGARMAVAIRGGTQGRPDPADGSIVIGPLALGPGLSTEVDTLLLAQLPAGDLGSFEARVRRLQASPPAALLAATRARWASSSSVATTDATVRQLFDKARFGLPGMVADDGSIDAGIFEYGLQWVRDTSNTTIGLLNAGHFELAHATLLRLLTKMVRDDGTPMAEGRFEPADIEELDQMGELLHAVREYRDWTGDDSLIREHRAQLLALVERPLQPRFRDADGLVHGRREYWERTFDDAYELIYQTYLVLGLREAAELAEPLGAEALAPHWRAEADRTLHAMLFHPTKSLVEDGCLIKRRSVTGPVVEELTRHRGHLPDAPNTTEKHRRIDPDASLALPIALGLIDPRSALARGTLDRLEALTNSRWSDGGYDRYNTSSEPDTPGPWPFATAFLLRAQHDAGLFERSRRSLEWLNTVQGGRAGAWFEEIPSTRGAEATCALIPWTSGEIALFVVHHYLGVGFEHGALLLRPSLYPGSPPVEADLRYRAGRLHLRVEGSGPARSALVNGRPVEVGPDGTVRLPADFPGGAVAIRCAPEPSR
jgi:hypothetical protein